MAALVLERALTANDLFKRQYPRTLRWASGLALAILALAVLTLPEYRPTPYALRDSEPWTIEEVEPIVPLERPQVKPPAAPRVPEIEPSPDPGAVETIPDPILEPVPYPEPLWDPAESAPFVAASETPRLLQGGRAEYPEMARLAGLQGLVMVKVLVGTDGRVVQVELLKGVHPLIDRPALAAARKLVFRPGTQRGLPVPCWVAVPFRFNLD
ncbi:MAG: TonB family protein [Candidatus Krumholzibacteriia bacterium]